MATDWVKAISEAGENDLRQIDDRIAVLKKELHALTAVRQVLRPNATTVYSRTKSIRPNKRTNDHQQEVVAYLKRVGTAGPTEILRECGIPRGSSAAVFNHPWFQRTQNGFALTADGRDAADRNGKHEVIA